jgi:hypothetical protein
MNEIDDDLTADDTDEAGVLTVKAMLDPESGWYAALTLPLPRAPEDDLLELARQFLVLYFDWVSGDLALRASPKEIEHAIKLGTDRLREITLAMPEAFAAQEEFNEEPWRPEMRHPPPKNFFQGSLI